VAPPPASAPAAGRGRGLDLCEQLGRGIADIATGADSRAPIAGPDVVDLRGIEVRAQRLQELRGVHNELSRLIALVAAYGRDMDGLQSQEIGRARERLDKVQEGATPPRGPPAGAAAAITAAAAAAITPAAGPAARENAWAIARSGARGPGGAAPPAVPGLRPGTMPIEIRGAGLSIPAIAVSSALKTPREILGAVGGGELYYIPQWGQFALRIGDCVIHANLGVVYVSPPPNPAARKKPEYLKECSRPGCPGSGSGCRYYHDPETHPGSTDVRNFVADSWLYMPCEGKRLPAGRHFGSLTSLKSDLLLMNPPDARRFLHQTMHDLLCSLVLWRYVLAPTLAAAPASSPL
jgi:hypothetical protein